MDFGKAYNRKDRNAIEKIPRVMKFSTRIIKLVQLLCAVSVTIKVTNDEKGERFRTKGSVRQGRTFNLYLL